VTLEQLRIFVAVAERQHVTRAADVLNLTQSAVSSAITTLEARHGVALFDRVGRGVVLNRAGEMFLAEARKVLVQAQAAESALADLSGLERGRLSVHASQAIASYWLPPRLARFHEAHPGVEIDVAIGTTAQVARSVSEGEAEIGLVEGLVDDASLAQSVVGEERLSLAVAPSHPWATTPRAADHDLTQTNWVLCEPGSGARAAFEQLLARRGLTVADLTVSMVLPGNEAVRSAVESGAGVMSRTVARLGVALNALVEIALDLPPRAFHLLRHKQRYRSQAGDAFVDVAERFAQEWFD
jgi:DNA-binding transcriptional LysR family regulator